MNARTILAAMAITVCAGLATADSISGGNATLTQGGQTVLEYVSGGEGFTAFKPYIRQLCSPAGVNPLRDNVADHIHHHALMFAVSVDGVDFWSETKGCGKQVQEGLTFRGSGGKPGSWARRCLQGQLDWVSSDGKPVASETRTIEVYGPATECSLMTWRTQLSPAEGKESMKLTGSHYFGLGMRFVQSMDKLNNFFFSDADAKGAAVRGSESVTPARWAAFTGPVDGKVVTVAMFDHPKNLRPVRWFTMFQPFSYLSATIHLYKEPLIVQADKPLDLRYGVAIWDGKVDREQVEKACKRWLELNETDK